jgi:transcriptional/translational regulatory protein YebC/TACO1
MTYIGQNTTEKSVEALSDIVKKSFSYAIFWMTKLLDMLEDNDDVQQVYHNWNMPDEDDED